MARVHRSALAVILAIAAPAAASIPQRDAAFDWFVYRGSDPANASQRPGPNAYRNPIVQGFYPDPSIVRVGKDFYLVNSTFTYFPGLPIFHSRDLVNWTQIGNAIDRPGQIDFKQLSVSRGLFAPSIRVHDGTFYIVNTCVDCGGNFVITAKRPEGPWSDPVFLPDLKGGIDPSLFFDDDGTAWIVNNDLPPGPPRYDGHRAIWLQQFDPAALKTFGPRTVLVDGGIDVAKKPVWIEGPHIFRKDGYHYLICAEGGTAENHSEVVLRSTNVRGPYQPAPVNPVLTQRDLPAGRPDPVTSTGHADFVDTGAGQWWTVFLGTRPYADDMYNTGRETFLLPVQWRDGWPHVTAPGEKVALVHDRPALPHQPAAAVPTSGPFTLRDDFSGRTLAPYWLSVRVPRTRWYRLDPAAGVLRLDARPVRLGDMGNPSFLVRRQQHLNASAATAVRFQPSKPGDEAGLAAFQNDDFWYLLAVGREGDRIVVRVKRRAGPKDDPAGAVIASAPIALRPGAPVDLRIDAHGGRYDFLYAIRPGQWRTLARGVDGTILSTKVSGGFVGAMFGLYAYGEPARAQ